MSYFQNRQMAVKWNGHLSKPYPLPGGGAQGGQLGQIEYTSQSNDNVDFLDDDQKYKFIDDLSILEILNLVMSNISSYNFKQHVAADIGTHGQFIPPEKLQSQYYLNTINDWTEQKQMALNRNAGFVEIYLISQFVSSFNID